MKNERDQDRVYVPLLRFEEGKFLLIFHTHMITFLKQKGFGNLNEFEVPFIVPVKHLDTSVNSLITMVA